LPGGGRRTGCAPLLPCAVKASGRRGRPSATPGTPVRFRRNSPKDQLQKPAPLPGPTGSVPFSPQGIPEPPFPRQGPKQSGFFGTSALNAAAANRNCARPGRGADPMRRLPQPKASRSLRFGFPPVGGRGGAPETGNAELKGRLKKGVSLRKGACLPQAAPGWGRGGYACPVLKL
jgi:hypothetical protein